MVSNATWVHKLINDPDQKVLLVVDKRVASDVLITVATNNQVLGLKPEDYATLYVDVAETDAMQSNIQMFCRLANPQRIVIFGQEITKGFSLAKNRPVEKLNSEKLFASNGAIIHVTYSLFTEDKTIKTAIVKHCKAIRENLEICDV